MNRSLPYQLADLHHQPVIVTTDAGLPVSIGQILLTSDAAGTVVVRVELEFETERLKCRLRVPPEKWAGLIEQWDGEHTCYVLPHGDGFWLDEHEDHKRRVVAAFLAVDGAGGRKPLRRFEPPARGPSG